MWVQTAWFIGLYISFARDDPSLIKLIVDSPVTYDLLFSVISFLSAASLFSHGTYTVLCTLLKIDVNWDPILSFDKLFVLNYFGSLCQGKSEKGGHHGLRFQFHWDKKFCHRWISFSIFTVVCLLRIYSVPRLIMKVLVPLKEYPMIFQTPSF